MDMCKILFGDLIGDDTGQNVLEYAFIAALIALGAIASMSSLSSKLADFFAAVGTRLTSST
ncbi:hypothetical protein [Granulicella tundricola]|uniref:Flp/Fap pilin component n=1 Tax=Granulicella tundricola (strain ATCC BAA-1859 / DSM 23138 / MP5ACTX9) TaxID=1198114 RepID=E8WWD1_GRATM|nr:hypothetical protein [Granulicella tundricola]ADW68514.1 hypothetical protein AciX9_1461 [Granulicella tundricola MP5ACTX9]